MFNRYLNTKYSIPIFPVILLDSGMIILEEGSSEAFRKHSSKVLHGIILAFGATDRAARCEYAPNVP